MKSRWRKDKCSGKSKDDGKKAEISFLQADWFTNNVARATGFSLERAEGDCLAGDAPSMRAEY